jgi:hypothetical protein
MDCPNCGTYNPEGRETCWRCDAVLPKPKPQKKRDPQKSAQNWLYVAIAIFLVITILQSCGFKLPFGLQRPEVPSPGSQMPGRPHTVYEVRSEIPWL